MESSITGKSIKDAEKQHRKNMLSHENLEVRESLPNAFQQVNEIALTATRAAQALGDLLRWLKVIQSNRRRKSMGLKSKGIDINFPIQVLSQLPKPAPQSIKRFRLSYKKERMRMAHNARQVDHKGNAVRDFAVGSSFTFRINDGIYASPTILARSSNNKDLIFAWEDYLGGKLGMEITARGMIWKLRKISYRGKKHLAVRPYRRSETKGNDNGNPDPTKSESAPSLIIG